MKNLHQLPVWGKQVQRNRIHFQNNLMNIVFLQYVWIFLLEVGDFKIAQTLTCCRKTGSHSVFVKDISICAVSHSVCFVFFSLTDLILFSFSYTLFFSKYEIMFLKRVIFITKIPEFREIIGLQTKENPSEIMLIFPLACPSLHHSSTADWREVCCPSHSLGELSGICQRGLRALHGLK